LAAYYCAVITVIPNAVIIQVRETEAATSQPDNEVSLAMTILLTRGAFVTPRSVIKNMTTKKRPLAEEIIKEMRVLEEKDVGYVRNITRTQTVFYKPTPVDDNKDRVNRILGSDYWDVYVKNFEEIDTVHITQSQHNRLLFAADNEEELESFGVTRRD
jgi:hypothetical protein